MKGQPNQQQVTPAMIKSGEVKVCGGCGNPHFLRPLQVILVSRLHPDNKTGQDITVNVPASHVLCVKCGGVGLDIPISKYVPAVQPDKPN